MKLSLFRNGLLSAVLATVSFGGPAFAEDSPVMAKFANTKVGSLLQFWALNDTEAANDANSNFRIRRAELKLSGSVHEGTRWFLMIDAAKTIAPRTDLTTGADSKTTDNKVLQDLGIAISLFDGFEVIVGQFKIPTFAEGFQSSSELLLPERSYITRTYGDRREPGIMLDYTFKPLRARVMFSNGQTAVGATATNMDDTNNSKDVNGRVDYAITETINVGVFGSNSVSAAAEGHATRYGGDIQFTMGDIFARVAGVSADDWKVKRNGMMADVGYMVMESVQVAGRYENFQRTTATKSASNAYTLGVNYFLNGNNLKVQLAHSFLNNMAGSNGSYKIDPVLDGSLTILNVQLAL